CADNLPGIESAVRGAFPKSEIQICIVHQIRNSLRYVSYKDLKEVSKDLKEIYQAPTEEMALIALERFEEKWGKKYPHIANSWRNNWESLATFFKYPPEIRRLIYTTNPIESLNSQIRKFNRSRTVFPNDEALYKGVYLAVMEVIKKWTGRIRDWHLIIAELAVYYEDRLGGYL
ncbi:MAG: transposase, partial [Sulfolobaceae archaeon]